MFVKLTAYRRNTSKPSSVIIDSPHTEYFNINTIDSFGNGGRYYGKTKLLTSMLVSNAGLTTIFYLKESPEHLDRLIKEALKA